MSAKNNINENKLSSKKEKVEKTRKFLKNKGFTIVELNEDKPWRAYFRIDSKEADIFIKQFFPGLSPIEARLGNENAELSPKILLVNPGQRLSWQYHERRAERWRFITRGYYCKSVDDELGESIAANSGDVIQFAKAERHRLIGSIDDFTVVAEIWQHTEDNAPSDEDDIIRLQDDYKR